MPLAVDHLDQEAQLWYQLLKEEEEEVSWVSLREGLHAHHSPTLFLTISMENYLSQDKWVQ